jgi:monoamine oxidase
MTTRRDFLRAVGVSGGAGAMFATMGALGLAPDAAHAAAPHYRAPSPGDFTLTGRAAKKVVVLGGGVAGLATAYELGKAGYDCTVLEARAVAGGRNRTIRGGDTETDLDGRTQRSTFSDGQYLNAGPARLAQWMVTLDYCRELGVPIEVFTNGNADALIFNAGMSAPVRQRTAKADVYGYVSELLTKATSQGALDASLTAADRDRLIAFLEDFGALSDGLYQGSGRRGYESPPGAGNDAGTLLWPPPSLSETFASGVGRYVSFEFGYDQAMTMFQPVGGMDAIPRALVAAIGARRVLTGAAVTSVTGTDGGVTVAYTHGGRARELSADFCVATLPPHLMARVPHNLGADVTAALGTFQVTPSGKIGLEYRGRWWENDLGIYGGITETDLDLAHIWYPSYDYHGRHGVLVGYYNTGRHALSYGALTHPERLERALTQGARIHGPRYREGLTSSFSIAWEKVPHLEGAWAYPRYDTPGYDLLLQPAGRVYFAGDWLSHSVAWQHGALVSARAAVTALHARVMTT